MKKIIFIELLRTLKSNPKLRRKVKIFLMVGAGLTLFIFVGTLWIGILGVNYASKLAIDTYQSPEMHTKINDIKEKTNTMQSFHFQSCLSKTLALLSVQPWIETPALQNIKSLKNECFQIAPKKCDVKECEKVDAQLKNNENNENNERNKI